MKINESESPMIKLEIVVAATKKDTRPIYLNSMFEVNLSCEFPK